MHLVTFLRLVTLLLAEGKIDIGLVYYKEGKESK
jgi:hypothetical protein